MPSLHLDVIVSSVQERARLPPNFNPASVLDFSNTFHRHCGQGEHIVPWALQLRKPVIVVKKITHHFSLVELRNGCQSKYIYICKNKSGLHGVSETSKCTRSLSARQSQKCRFGLHQNILIV